MCFIDFVAAFDSIDRTAFSKIIRLIKEFYKRTSAQVYVHGEQTDMN